MFAPAPHLSLHEVNLSPKRPIFPRRRDLLHFLTHKCSKPSSFIPDIENRNKKVEDPERFSSDTSSTWIFVLFLSRVLLRYMYIIFGYTLYIFGHILHTSFAKCHPRSKKLSVESSKDKRRLSVWCLLQCKVMRFMDVGQKSPCFFKLYQKDRQWKSDAGKSITWWIVHLISFKPTVGTHSVYVEFVDLCYFYTVTMQLLYCHNTTTQRCAAF